MATKEIKPAKIKLEQLFADAVKSAEVVNLIYVNDSEPGITRKKVGDSFAYYLNKKKVADKDVLQRIRRLVIPPAWQNVWISPNPDGHLQVTGIDVKGRKQYKYHPDWSALRNQTKFSHLYQFGKALPSIRAQIAKDLARKELCCDKVLATVVSLMECTGVRIGNSMYEKLYGSYGLSTMKDGHVKIEGSNINFAFKGKKGVFHKLSLKSKKLAKIVRQCRDIPGKELFQYYDENGQRKSIDSGMVNAYIKRVANGNFTAKDFRTWAGSLHALKWFKSIEPPTSLNDAKKKTVLMLDSVAKHLGNTRTVCKKYYVHPLIPEHFANNTLGKYLKKMDDTTCDTGAELTSAEQVLMKILQNTKVMLNNLPKAS